MPLDSKFMELTRNLINQKKGEYFLEQSRKRKIITDDAASRGFSSPPGYVYGYLHDMQVESVRSMKDIVWSSLEETLDAFNTPYYPELDSELFAFCESYFPESLSEPHAQLKSMGWEHPHEEIVNEQVNYNRLKAVAWNQGPPKRG